MLFIWTSNSLTGKIDVIEVSVLCRITWARILSEACSFGLEIKESSCRASLRIWRWIASTISHVLDVCPNFACRSWAVLRLVLVYHVFHFGSTFRLFYELLKTKALFTTECSISCNKRCMSPNGSSTILFCSWSWWWWEDFVNNCLLWVRIFSVKLL